MIGFACYFLVQVTYNMGRRPGARNADFAAERDALVAKLATRLAEPGAARSSMRDLAAAAEVSVATLQHYFGDRTGVFTAVFEGARQGGKVHLDAVAEGPLGSLRTSIQWFLEYATNGLMEFGLGHLHELGLTAGARDEVLGPAYLANVLEPTLQALERRLSRHQAAGQLRPCDVRIAALELVAPLLVAVLHQHSLGGTAQRPLSLDEFLKAHLAAFLRAYASAARPAKA